MKKKKIITVTYIKGNSDSVYEDSDDLSCPPDYEINGKWLIIYYRDFKYREGERIDVDLIPAKLIKLVEIEYV